MAIVVVGGHTRNVGKTSVVEGLIRALPEMRWTAFKVTQFGHGMCSANGEPCDCETAEHTVAVSEERLGGDIEYGFGAVSGGGGGAVVLGEDADGGSGGGDAPDSERAGSGRRMQ